MVGVVAWWKKGGRWRRVGVGDLYLHGGPTNSALTSLTTCTSSSPLLGTIARKSLARENLLLVRRLASAWF